MTLKSFIYRKSWRMLWDYLVRFTRMVTKRGHANGANIHTHPYPYVKKVV